MLDATLHVTCGGVAGARHTPVGAHMATLSTQHASLLPAACQYFEHEHRYGDMEILAAITHMWRQGNTS